MAESIPELKAKLDKIFSKFIRLRDALITTGTKEYAICVTCDTRKPIKLMDAGHWRGRSKGSTRYDEHNVSAQCRSCNRFKHGMVEEHRRSIVEKYGTGEDERLFRLSNKVHKFDKSWLKKEIEYYKKEHNSMLEYN